MDLNNKNITLGNGEKYLVIKQVNYEGKTYVYLVNYNNEFDSMFAEIKDNAIAPIEPKLFQDKILPMFTDKLTDKN